MCSACESFNGTYLLTGNGSTWTYTFTDSFWCRAGDGQDIWNGVPYYSDARAFVGYHPTCKLTRTATVDSGCLWQLTWWIASADQYIGDDLPTSDNHLYINTATWEYIAPYGEQCAKTKNLNLVFQQHQGFVDFWTVSGGGDFNDIGIPENDPKEANEGTFINQGPLCSAGPNFPETVTIVAG